MKLMRQYPARARTAALLSLVVLLLAPAVARAQKPNPAPPRDVAGGFSHQPHRKVACAACHEQKGQDLGPARLSQDQCHSCHHTGPVAGACTRCHAPGKLSQGKRTMQPFRLTVSPTPVMRSVVFNHQAHASTECSTCHKQPPRLAAGGLSCSGCHESHHEPDVECLSCHIAAPDSAHRNSSHLTCAGSDCHRSTPVPATARTRQVCLTCHAKQVKHYPTGNCVECHVMPMQDQRRAKR